MLAALRRFAHPGNAACFAALLVAIGVEVEHGVVVHILEGLGGFVALIGFFIG